VLAATASGTFVKMVTVLGPGTITNFNNGIQFTGTSGGGAVGVTLTGNAFAGFDAGNDANNVAPTGLLISQNLITNNHGDGIEGAPITNSTIIGNTITGSVVHDGIALFFNSTNNQILGNISNNNKQDGIDLQPGVSGNTIKGNQTNSNGDNGIAVAATKTHFSGNVSFGNGSNGGPLFDMVDQNANCVTDTYSSDVFGTANQSCVK
jgi:parallel beta-helix repeat protein